MVVLTTMLISIVEVSNVFAVLIVFLVFCVMVIFILRLHNADQRMTSVTFMPHFQIHQQPMIKICNPFVLSLKTFNGDNLSLSSVICNVSSQVPWMLQTFWGVSIADLHPTLSFPSFTMRMLIINKEFLSNVCLQQGCLQYYSECRDKEVCISPTSAISPEDLGVSPRSKYPLVVVMLRQDGTIEENGEHEVEAMVSVIHIHDHLCQMQSCILVQYLKMTNGQLSTLKPLYVTSDEDQCDGTVEENSTESMLNAEHSDNKNEAACVICRSAPVTRVLLPCRHTCTCAKCFPHLDKCPMCRCPISSYFCISNEDTSQYSEVNSSDQQALNMWQRIEQWNDSLNRLLGLT